MKKLVYCEIGRLLEKAGFRLEELLKKKRMGHGEMVKERSIQVESKEKK